MKRWKSAIVRKQVGTRLTMRLLGHLPFVELLIGRIVKLEPPLVPLPFRVLLAAHSLGPGTGLVLLSMVTLIPTSLLMSGDLWIIVALAHQCLPDRCAETGTKGFVVCSL